MITLARTEKDELSPGKKSAETKGPEGLKEAGGKAAVTRTANKYGPVIKEVMEELGEQEIDYQHMKKYFEKYSWYKENTLQRQIYSFTVNNPGRLHYGKNQKARGYDEAQDLLYELDGTGRLVRYDPSKHGKWTIMLDENGNAGIARDGVLWSNDSGSPLLKFLKDNPTMFQNYQAVVIKTLLENASKFSATINEIKNKIVELNFDREDFEINSGWVSVKEALGNHNIISIDGENVKLNDVNISDNEKTECLKICGQKIAKFHIDKIVKGDYNLWRMPPGSVKENYPYEREFLKSNTIGIGWGKLEGDVVEKNMTKEQTEELFHKKYPPTDDDPNSPQAFTNFTHEMKPKDIIVLIKKKTILDFAIVVGSYRYQKDPSIDLPDMAKSYGHRRDVVWLNRGPIPESEAFEFARMSACDRVKDAQLKEQYITILLGEKEPKYFLLRHNVKGAWKDDPGKKYHLGRDKKDGRMGKRVRQILDAGVGTKTIWYSTSKSKGVFYFWGYGTVTGIEEEKKDTDWYLTYNDFKFFDGDVDVQGRRLKRATESVNQQLQELQHDKEWKMNWQLSINPIPKKIYEEITGDRSTMSALTTQQNLDKFAKALDWKPNLILYGPPGTGKTYHAKKIAESITSNQVMRENIVELKPQTWLGVGAKVLLDNNGTALHYNDFAKFARQIRNTDAVTPEETIARDIRHDIRDFGDDTIFTNPSEAMYGLNVPTTFVKAAEIILLAEHRPLHTDEITEIAVSKTMIRQNEQAGITPTRSMNQVITQDIANDPDNSIFVQTAPATYVLRSQINISSDVKEQPFTNIVTFHQTFSYEEFMEGIKAKITNAGGVTYEIEDGIFKKFCELAGNDDPKNKYIMIIDEINRGNIAKIFGELITIIEKDKREIPITLAYSKKPFSVPKNVFIIGTMNTADQSLTHLDAALKRRFTMMEIYPESEKTLKHKKVNGIDLTELLDAVNKKLVDNKLRDNQIGHAYFMDGDDPLVKISDLQMVFAYDIIPLLREYFYDDESKIKSIFGKDHWEDWFDENDDINPKWLGSGGENTFRDNIKKSFGV